MLKSYVQNLRFPTLPHVPAAWVGLEVHQAVGQHDLAVVTLSESTVSAVQHPTGTPISFQFGRGGAKVWTGYVHSTEPRREALAGTISVQALGPTYALSNARQRAWPKASASAIVAQLCHEQSLAAQVSHTTRVYDQISQAGMTDWQLINRLADESGRLVIPDGSVVRFLSRADVLARFDFSDHLRLDYTRSGDSQILSYSVSHTEDSGRGTRHGAHSLAGVDPRTAAVVNNVQPDNYPAFGQTTGTAPFTDVQAQMPVNSAYEASALQVALTETTSWKYRIQARVIGDERMGPGSLVALTGIGEYNAVWVIESAAHLISQTGYFCELELVADALGEPPVNYRNRRPQVLDVLVDPVLRKVSAADQGSAAAFGGGLWRWQASRAIPTSPSVPGRRSETAMNSVRRATKIV